MIAHRTLALIFSLSLAGAAPAFAAGTKVPARGAATPSAKARATLDYRVAKTEFRRFIKATPGMRSLHRRSLFSATTDTLTQGVALGIGAGGLISLAAAPHFVIAAGAAPEHAHGIVVGGIVGAGALVTGTATLFSSLFAKENLQRARTETVGQAFLEKKLSASTAKRWEKAQLISGHWK